MAPRIVVAHTLDDMRELYEEIFSLVGYSCVTFPLALPLPLSDLYLTAPDLLVFDDILLSAEEGCALLRELRQSPKLASTPVIVCSSMVHTALSNACFLDALGIHVLIKPFELDALLELTERVLQQHV